MLNSGSDGDQVDGHLVDVPMDGRGIVSRGSARESLFTYYMSQSNKMASIRMHWRSLPRLLHYHVERHRLHIPCSLLFCHPLCVVLAAKAVKVRPTISTRTKGIPAYREPT